MLYATLITALVLSGNVQGFQFRSAPTAFSAIRHSPSSSSRHQFQAARQASVVVQSKTISEILSVANINKSLRAAQGQMKRSLSVFLQSSMEKKLVTVAYPLTIVLLYLFFSSTFVTVHAKKMITSMSEVAKSVDKSVRKTGQNVSKLAKSFAKAKVEDENLTKRNILIESEMKAVEETTRLANDASIAQAKKDIESKLQFIVQSEEKVKSQKAKVVEDVPVVVQLAVVTEAAPVAVAVATVAVASSVSVPIVAVAEEAKPILIAEVKKQEASVAEAVLTISSSALVSTKKVMAPEDATVAMLFILAVGSPILQVLHQYMIAA